MNIQWLLAIAVSLPILLSVGVTLMRKYHRHGTNQFFYAGGTLDAGWGAELFISTSLALGNAVVYFAYLGYIAGSSGIWFQIAWCAGFIFLAFFAEQIAARVRNRTIHTVLGEVFGVRAAKIAALATITGFTLNLGWELVAGFSIFSVLNLSPWASILCILLLAGGAAFYTAHGGMRGNLLPNRIFNIMSYVSLVLLVVFLALKNLSETDQLITFLHPSLSSLVIAVGLGGVLTNIFFSILWQFVDMSAWQNLAATTTEGKAPTRSLVYSSLVLLFIPGVAGISIGMLLRNISGVTADNLLSSVVTMLSAYPALFIIVISGLIAAMLSTIDGFLLASANTIVQDIFGLSEQDSGKGLKIARASIILLALLGATLVFSLNKYAKINLFNLVYVTYSAQLALFPAVMAILLRKKVHASIGALGLIAGIFGGLGVALYASFENIPDLLTWAPLIGLGISALLVGAGWLKARTA